MIAMMEPQRDPNALLAELREAGADVRNANAIRCPFHDDRNPSAGIYQGEDGHWRFKCHGGSCGFNGDLYDVRAKASGREVGEILREENDTPRTNMPKRKPAEYDSVAALRRAFASAQAFYFYTHPETRATDLIVIRMPKRGKNKPFFQAHERDGKIILTRPPVELLPLYNRSRILKSERVVVVEGEKDVHTLHDLEVVATTSPMGAGKSEHADWSPLAGKTVYLWPDNDAAGIAHMRAVLERLQNLDPAPTVLWIDPASLNLPAGGDVSDLIAEYAEADRLTRRSVVTDVLTDAKNAGTAEDVEKGIEAVISGTWRAERWPWQKVTALSKALLPGTLTLLCGDPGATKSFFLLEALAFWHNTGTKCCCYELEEDRRYHAHRALAQIEGNGDLLNDDWMFANPDDAREASAKHADFLNSFGPCIHEAPDKQVTLDELAGWVRDRAKEGNRIIAVDPVTAAEATAKPWIDDSRFVIAAKSAAREYGASIVLVTHPKKGRKNAIGMDELAGGAAYSRFAQTILWIERHKAPKDVIVGSVFGRQTVTINRTLHLSKTRNGMGHGMSIGFTFDGSLRFREHGVIQGDDE